MELHCWEEKVCFPIQVNKHNEWKNKCLLPRTGWLYFGLDNPFVSSKPVYLCRPPPWFIIGSFIDSSSFIEHLLCKLNSCANRYLIRKGVLSQVCWQVHPAKRSRILKMTSYCRALRVRTINVLLENRFWFACGWRERRKRRCCLTHVAQETSQSHSVNYVNEKKQLSSIIQVFPRSKRIQNETTLIHSLWTTILDWLVSI